VNSTAEHLGAEACQPSGTLNVRWIPELREYFEEFLDPIRLTSDLTSYAEWATANSAPVLQGGFLHRPTGTNMSVAAIWASKDWEANRPDLPPPPGAKRLAQLAFSLAALEFHAPDHFDESAREFLQQKLQAPEEIWGIICEILTSVYFIRKGAKVAPLFLRKSAPNDLMIRLLGEEVPVQCKSKKPGAGRAVADETFNLLAGYIARDASDSGRKVLVRIGATAEVRPSDVPALRAAVANIVVGGSHAELVDTGGRVYSVRTEVIKGDFTLDNAHEFLRSYDFHISMQVAIPEGESGTYTPIVVVGLVAEPVESPWTSLQGSINDASDQLKKNPGPPGISAIDYADPVGDVNSLRPGIATCMDIWKS